MIDVLLATYNGAPFLPGLLASLEAQDFSIWRLIVRDDLSNDGSLDLIKEWSSKSGRPISIVDDNLGRLGPSENFGRLLQTSSAPYFMFCDQDDIWLPSKITTLLNCMRKAEFRFGTTLPILAHSDLVVVDENLSEINSSFWSILKRYDYEILPGREGEAGRRRLILENVVTGCASIGNSSLRIKAQPIPPSAFMHDWWAALVAGHMGAIVSTPQPTILYRQHSANTLGYKHSSYWQKLARILKEPATAAQRAKSLVTSIRLQADTFAQKFPHCLNSPAGETLRQFSDLNELGVLQRKTFLLKHNIWPRKWMRGAILSAFL